MDFFSDLDPLLKTFWFFAIPASIIFLIQTVMTFTGMDAHDGIDADFNSNLEGTDAPFQLFTFRNLINFMLGFSWTGISLYAVVNNSALLIVISMAVGAVFVGGFFLIIRQIERLAEDNTFRISHTLNKTGSVYLSIPGRKKGTGKVQVSVKGAVREIDAITENEKIETSSTVRIIKIESENLVLVEKV
jgi:hypothetical protein